MTPEITTNTSTPGYKSHVLQHLSGRGEAWGVGKKSGMQEESLNPYRIIKELARTITIALSARFTNTLIIFCFVFALMPFHPARSDHCHLPALAMQTIICNDSPTSANLRHTFIQLYQYTEQSVTCCQFITMNCSQFFSLVYVMVK